MGAGRGLIPWDHRARGSCCPMEPELGEMRELWGPGCTEGLLEPPCPAQAVPRGCCRFLLAWEPRDPLPGGAEQPLLLPGDGMGWDGSSSLFPAAQFQPQLQDPTGSSCSVGSFCGQGQPRLGQLKIWGLWGWGGFGRFVWGCLCPIPGWDTQKFWGLQDWGDFGVSVPITRLGHSGVLGFVGLGWLWGFVSGSLCPFPGECQHRDIWDTNTANWMAQCHQPGHSPSSSKAQGFFKPSFFKPSFLNPPFKPQNYLTLLWLKGKIQPRL